MVVRDRVSAITWQNACKCSCVAGCICCVADPLAAPDDGDDDEEEDDTMLVEEGMHVKGAFKKPSNADDSGSLSPENIMVNMLCIKFISVSTARRTFSNDVA